MWSLLWHAWRWSETLTWSTVVWCGQFVNGCQAILGLSVASTMLAASLLADTGVLVFGFHRRFPCGVSFKGFLAGASCSLPCDFGSLSMPRM
ncbi:hypothetical protein V6N12_037385 [Hibiscus sabdariffa]|uniref:Secreted protein n=1 Tax=Hibiscus sabdariffa TaxID=183260 RepID=A0ABR2BZ24_9ROSI